MFQSYREKVIKKRTEPRVNYNYKKIVINQPQKDSTFYIQKDRHLVTPLKKWYTDGI